LDLTSKTEKAGHCQGISVPSARYRDQIYFIDKDNDTAVSELYSLDEYSVRTREDVRKSYLNGKFGAVPNIG
jgi:AAA15 family ATPase/GTPase